MEDLILQFEKRLARYNETERQEILKAARWSEGLHKGQSRASGDPYIIHPIKVAETLVDMEMDQDTVIAALLHDIIEDTDVPSETIGKLYGKRVETLVNGVTKINILQVKSKTIQRSETIRKMLLAMTKDIRVILIKLADKLHNMNTLEHQPPDKRKITAEECLDIYAPLADRLGIFWLKGELEDLSLKHLQGAVYSQIKDFLAERKVEKRNYLRKVERAILNEASKAGLDIKVSTRAKHIYSVYRKMKYREKELAEILDFLGVRILCSTVPECYHLLGVVHTLWPPIEGTIKDYIAMPKANGYQSLHTVVMSYQGAVIEVQIRTHEMHMRAEYGVAAHWRYKANLPESSLKPTDIALINKLKSWDGLANESEEFLSDIKRDILKDSIYVFSPKGDIIELPAGSTAIDFAYHIHTEVGDRCIGAKADGNIIPLNRELKNTQAIQIMTSAKAMPHVNWLRHVKTSRARSKIRHWLNHHNENLIVDRSIIAKRKPTAPAPPEPEPDDEGAIVKSVVDHEKVVFRIGGEKNMMIKIANCCSPTTGDDIIGYISRGRGIIVHRRNCSNLRNINQFEQRSVDVEWEAVTPRSTQRFRINARMTSDLFSEIEGAVRKYKGHLIEGKLDEDERGNLHGAFTLEIERQEDFKNLMKSIRTIPTVLNIQSVN
jgi:GTP diphosphokinase / guanosine-3',5'-bis(diphosphate) 3'-diphosphatase